MKATTKRNAIASLAAACALTLCTGLLISGTKTVSAEETSGTYAYYYEHITLEDSAEKALAKKFYEALDEMNEAGDFKDGVVSYPLSDILKSDQIQAWVENGNVSIPRSFSAARDSYYMDHPELFYIDIYKMTISAASNGSAYTAYIDCGREANLYADDGFKSEAQVETALTAYAEKVDEIADYAVAEANKEQYGTAKKVLQARYANQYIATNTAYDDLSAASSAITTASPAQTAYGALINGTAVCNGYSRAFKAVMDKLGIPCIVVNGYSISKNSQGEKVELGEGHAWNYVWFETPVAQDDSGIATQAEGDGAWYGYDVTWNSTSNKPNAYIDMGNFAMLKEHWPDGEISTSGYLAQYPELSDYAYGCKTDSNGIVYSIDYIGTGDGYVDKYGNEAVEIWTSVSYNGKGAVKLFEEDSLRIIYRWCDMGADGLRWSLWMDLYAEITVGAYGKDNVWGNFEMYTDTDYETKIYGNTSILYIQFAVVDGSEESGIKPNVSQYDGFDNMLTVYNQDIDLSEYVVTLSDIAVNDSYMTYVPAPHVVSSVPDHKNVNIIKQSWAIPGTNQMDDQYAFEMYVTYHEPLKVLDTSKPIGVSFTSASFYSSAKNIYEYAHFVPLSEDENGEKIWVEIVGEEQNTLRFKFCPSLMYEHNGMHYYFTFSNVGSAFVNYLADGSEYVSEKTPNVLIHNFCREYIACNKCLPNGRMLLDCVAQPMLLSNTDLSEVGFQDEDGNYFSAGQRSQMMLVVNKPTEAENEKMNELLEESTEFDVSQEELKAAETYEIDLQICARYVYIPNGSYVKIALGFPEGYGPDDEGVTFKIYHYKRSADRKQIIGVEEIPCVVTRFGIVATVESFSPFMVVPVAAEKATTKNVYASVDGNGGGLNNADGQIQTLKEGESYTYTIKPDDGYSVYSVMLNRKEVKNRIVDGKLTLAFDDLAVNNELEIKYISNEAALRYEQNNINVVEPVKVVIATNGEAQTVTGAVGATDLVPGNGGGNFGNGGEGGNGGNNNTTLIICLAVVAVVIVAAAVTVVVLAMQGKKKKN